MSTSSRSALAALLAMLPPLATAGVVSDMTQNPAPRALTARSGYVLRCWQDGRLILEEQHVSAPMVSDAAATKLHLQDRNRQPLYVAETRNATCLVRAVPPARTRSALP